VVVAVAVVVVVVAVFIGDLSDGPLFPHDRLERSTVSLCAVACETTTTETIEYSCFSDCGGQVFTLDGDRGRVSFV